MRAPAPKEAEYAFDLSGGRLCLDFANTVSDRPSERPVERLRRYADLLAWGRQAGLLDEGEAQRLSRRAEGRPAEAEAVLLRARQLREVLYRIFEAFSAARPPEAADLAALNASLPEALSRLRLETGAQGFTWGWASDEGSLDGMLWPVLRSAAELMASEDLASVRSCAADRCQWLFLDKSRNRSRRWCDMKVCGNRDKARRHYRRRKAAQ